jgi:hypothetical protein
MNNFNSSGCSKSVDHAEGRLHICLPQENDTPK